MMSFCAVQQLASQEFKASCRLDSNIPSHVVLIHTYSAQQHHIHICQQNREILDNVWIERHGLYTIFKVQKSKKTRLLKVIIHICQQILSKLWIPDSFLAFCFVDDRTCHLKN